MDNVVTEITGAETNFFATDLHGFQGSKAIRFIGDREANVPRPVNA